ncbi:flavin reductase family protein [Alkalicoccus chagannorensis]|uniref:flavin reductase family protein n=1 Tax=Alkalicoccus chagannorensis TaxID=427072 RepID=UPI00041D2F7B|nr:flavin reductase family protein [Alkalicoccus chagannorensis]
MDSKQGKDPFSEVYDLRSRGVFFVSTADEEKAHFHFGCWTTQASHDPPRMITCFPKEFEGTDIVRRGGVWGLSMAAHDQEQLHDQFFSGSHAVNDLGEEHFFYGETGVPLLKEAVAYFECRLSSIIDSGDFVIAIGDIVKGEALHPEKKTLNVEYLSAEREKNYMTGPLTLPFEGFPFKRST